ncbi:hypothetical protein C8Q79DRAFT_112381 [Trametes meyenii]|nr:hypothetical protein C8Q79DRAFT_112381 [Trametes meyenii]
MLPTSVREKGGPPPPRIYVRYLARRYLAIAVIAFGVVALFRKLIYWDSDPPQTALAVEEPDQEVPPLPTSTPLPPLYERFNEAELRLPQHHWDQRRPNGGEKFLFVAGHSRNCGWGNAMQELILNAYMAYKAGRSFVFANYTWNANDPHYSEYNGKKIPARIPYTALIRGPIVGASFPPGDPTPLAVQRDYFETVCSQKVTYIREDISNVIEYKNSAKEITDGWHRKLAGINEPCVQTSIHSGQIYNFDVFGDPRAMLDIWPELSASPILTHFGWSPLVELAFDTNRDLFLPPTSPVPYLASVAHTAGAVRYPPLPGLMAVHVRRGDFEGHCAHLATYGSDYAAFSSFPEMVDRFAPPPGTTVEERMAVYRPHCFPSVDEIVARVGEVRASAAAAGVRRLHVMTNGDAAFIRELKAALHRAQTWQSVTSSRDMVLNWEQKYVAQAVDMLVAQRAQVFIGNGWSTLTSNVVMLRMANRFPADSTRFW